MCYVAVLINVPSLPQCFTQLFYSKILFSSSFYVAVAQHNCFKTVATRCHILKLKCTKFDFSWGSAAELAGGAYSASQTP